MDNKLSDIIKTTLENVKGIVESNTVIGEPVNTTNGVVIIPVSKVSVGAGIGGGEYGAKKNKKKENRRQSMCSAERLWQ